MSALNQAYEPSAALLFGFTLFVIGRLWLVRVPRSPLAGTQPGWYALRTRLQATSILDQSASCRSKSAAVPCCRFAVSFLLLVKPYAAASACRRSELTPRPADQPAYRRRRFRLLRRVRVATRGSAARGDRAGGSTAGIAPAGARQHWGDWANRGAGGTGGDD